MLKLGYNEATCMENSSVIKDLQLCEKYGYDAIELRLDMLKDYLRNHSLNSLKSFFAKSHLCPFALNSIENINFTTDKQWQDLVNLFLFGCKIAKEIKIPYLIVVPTVGKDINKKNEEEVLGDSVDVLRKLSELAAPYGVGLSFEPIGDRHWCCNSLRQALEIIQAVNKKNVGLTVDCINFYMHDKCADLEFIRQIPKEKLFVFHINDCEDLPLGLLEQCNRLMPGDGCIPVAEIIRRVQAVGYDGPACVELFRPEYWKMDAEKVIQMAAIKTRKFL
ncbi:MAG: sugar phosphate isomerase/epimerase [Spirochaetia bacterium]|jgi:2-keto-myo-inositol isomerase|nr:sugar phosphate isomerase/epimerase [Spirochaetia bacterium]